MWRSGWWVRTLRSAMEGSSTRWRASRSKAGLKGQRVRVEERLDGSLVAQWSGKSLSLTMCEAATRVAAAVPVVRKGGVKKSGKSGNPRWMHGFDLDSGPSLEQVVEHAYGESEEECERAW